MLLNHLKMVKMVNHILCILCHNKQIKLKNKQESSGEGAEVEGGCEAAAGPGSSGQAGLASLPQGGQVPAGTQPPVAQLRSQQHREQVSGRHGVGPESFPWPVTVL